MDPIESVFLQLLSLLYIELIWEREGDTDTVINVRAREEESNIHVTYYYLLDITITLY